MVSLRKSTLVVVFALVATLLVGGGVLAASVGRNGKAVTAVLTVTSPDEFYLYPASNTWVDVPNMKTFVTVPKDQRAILLVTFSMSASCPTAESSQGSTCLMRVLLDGQEVPPGRVQWEWARPSQPTYVSVRSMQWVAGPVGPGEHQVKVQVSQVGGSVLGTSRTLTVLRAKF